MHLLVHFTSKFLFWICCFLRYVVLTLLLGSLVGALLFLVLGGIFSNFSALFLLKKGLVTGFKYAGVWAGGLGIVLCVMKAYEINKNKTS